MCKKGEDIRSRVNIAGIIGEAKWMSREYKSRNGRKIEDEEKTILQLN